MPYRWRIASLLAVSVLGVALSVFVPRALATRNSSGTYSLPSGNPVTSGTPITSAWANTTLSDLGTEMTSSLDRSGRGAMLAPLQCSNGTNALPSLTFGSDTDTGLYRIGANNPGMSAGGTKAQEWTASGSAVTGTFSVSGATTLTGATTQTGALATAAGITATQSTSNGLAIIATGNGTGQAGKFTGGSSGGCALYALANGATALGTTDCGIAARGGSSNGYGVVGFNGGGTGGGVIGYVTGSNVDTDGAFALTAGEAGIGGHIKLAGGNPSSTKGFTNVLTASNVLKAWGTLTPNGAGTVAVASGFNVASVTCGNTGNDDYIVTMSTGSSGTNNYVVVPTTSGAGAHSSFNAINVSSTVFHIRNADPCDSSSGAGLIGFIVVGLQ